MRCLFAFCVALLLIGCGSSGEKWYTREIERGDPIPRVDDVKVAWLGVFTLAITDGETTIIVDPFVTRPSLGCVVGNEPLASNPEVVDWWVDELCIRSNIGAVIVTHSHYDHLLDGAAFVQLANHEHGGPRAKLYGSRSTLIVGKTQGLTRDELFGVSLGEPIRVGDFTMTFLPDVHGPHVGDITLAGGVIDPDEFTRESGAWEWCLGASYAVVIEHSGRRLLLSSGTGRVEVDTFTEQRKAEVAILGVGGLDGDDIDDFIQEVPLSAGVEEVIPTHFDNFFVPLTALVDDCVGIHAPPGEKVPCAWNDDVAPSSSVEPGGFKFFPDEVHHVHRFAEKAELYGLRVRPIEIGSWYWVFRDRDQPGVLGDPRFGEKCGIRTLGDPCPRD
ncbi:MAG: MBL fold metallo-hydrolase [Planctomycetota bacterium]